MGHIDCDSNNLQHPYAPKSAIFFPKSAKNTAVWSNIDFFGFGQVVGDPPYLRLPVAKKHIVGTQRSRKHNLQHPYAPKIAIFHDKTAKNGFLLVKH